MFGVVRTNVQRRMSLAMTKFFDDELVMIMRRVACHGSDQNKVLVVLVMTKFFTATCREKCYQS